MSSPLTETPLPHDSAPKSAADGTTRPFVLQRRFAPMWSAFSLGVFADNMLRQALLIGVTFGHITLNGLPEGLAVPIIGALFAFAMLVFSTISGQVADKVETAIMLRRTKFIEMLIMASAAVGLTINSGELLVASLFAMGIQSAFFSPVRIGAMPKYFSTQELISANAFFSFGLFVSILLGLFLGGMLIEQPGGRMTVAAFLVVASVVGYVTVRGAPPAAPTAPDLTLDWNIFRQGAQIFSYAFGAPGVVRPMLGFALFYYMSTLVTVLITIYVPDALGGDGSVANLIMFIFTLGAGAGAMSAAMLSRGTSGLGSATAGVGFAGIMTLAIIALTGVVAASGATSISALLSSPAGIALCVCFMISAGAMGLFIVPLQAAIQRRAPKAQRARIMAASNMLNAGAAVLGSLSVLVVTVAKVPSASAFLVVAVLQMLIAAYMFNRRRTVPAGLYDEMLATPNVSAPDET